MSSISDPNLNLPINGLSLEGSNSPTFSYNKKLSETTPKRSTKRDDSSESSSSSSDSQTSNDDAKQTVNNFPFSPKKPEEGTPKATFHRPLRGSVAPSQIDAFDPSKAARSHKSIFMDKNALSAPDFLKEYRYRRRSSRSIIKHNNNNEARESQRMARIPFMKKGTRSSISSSQGGLSPTPIPPTHKKSIMENKLTLDQKQVSESQIHQASFVTSETSDDEPDMTPRRRELRRKFRVGLRVAYFLGILFSLKNRVKIYGALRPYDHMKNYEVKKVVEDKRKSFLPLLPTDTFTIVWTILLILLLILTALLTPYRVSFVDDSDPTFKIIDLMFDVGFGFDMLVNFVRAYHDPVQGLVTNKVAIVVNYVKAWFWIDLIAIFPFDTLIDAVTEGQSQTAHLNKLFRLLRFPRLYRLLKILRIFKMVNIFSVNQTLNRAIKKLNLNIGIIRIFKVLINILFLNHLVGCVWFLAARMTDFDPDTWVVQAGLRDKSSWDQYIASYYWAFQTLTTVGFGDLPPRTFFERIIAIIWMVVGVGFYSFTIGNLSTILANIDRKSAILKTKLTTFNSFSIKIKLPEYLRQKVQRFFELNHKENVYYWMDPQEMLKELPANLKTSLLLYSYYGMIKNIRLLQLDANFTASIITQLKLLKLKKKEILYREGDPAEEIYFISKGAIKFVNEMGQSIYALTEGTYFGEAETLADEKRMSFCQATESTILLVCERASFLESLKDFPTIEMQIKRTLQTRKAKYEEKVALLKELAESKAENEEPSNVNQKSGKLMNSTEYFNEHIVKNFIKEKKSPKAKPNGPTENRQASAKVTPQLVRKPVPTSASPQSAVSSTPALKKEPTCDSSRFRPPLEVVSEERHSPMTPGRTLQNLKQDKSSVSINDEKTSLSFSAQDARSRLFGLLSPKEDERALLDENRFQPSTPKDQDTTPPNRTDKPENNDSDQIPISVWKRQPEPEFPSLLFSKAKKISQRDLRSQAAASKNKPKVDDLSRDSPKSKWLSNVEGKLDRTHISEVSNEDRRDNDTEKDVAESFQGPRIENLEKQETASNEKAKQMDEDDNSEEETSSQTTPMENLRIWLNKDKDSSKNDVKSLTDSDQMYCSIKPVEFGGKREAALLSGANKSSEVPRDSGLDEVKLKSVKSSGYNMKDSKIKLDNLISILKKQNESDDESDDQPESRQYNLEGEDDDDESDFEDILRGDF